MDVVMTGDHVVGDMDFGSRKRKRHLTSKEHKSNVRNNNNMWCRHIAAKTTVRKAAQPLIAIIALTLIGDVVACGRTMLRTRSISQYNKQLILDLHNAMRQSIALGQIGGQPPAANMMEMLIEGYESNPCLFNVKRKDYHNKQKRNVALNQSREISQKQISDIQRKWNGIRNTYSKIYVAKLWYNNQLQFLNEFFVSSFDINETASTSSNDLDIWCLK
ncbi:unnamed protein product [Diabrotica balteata]|uniref:MADF domain-containing protein n=1 Tax=Diabrotica balteata TaxID=107213 RepID=A0A9N9T4Z7_DIABA|nr:unnamed protein product [Diabrotica balteata]